SRAPDRQGELGRLAGGCSAGPPRPVAGRRAAALCGVGAVPPPWRAAARVSTQTGDHSMASIFTKIIAGELPGRFVWKDDRAVAILTIAPIVPGHTLVIPRQEVDHWLDLDAGLRDHLFDIAQSVGRGLQRA